MKSLLLVLLVHLVFSIKMKSRYAVQNKMSEKLLLQLNQQAENLIKKKGQTNIQKYQPPNSNKNLLEILNKQAKQMVQRQNSKKMKSLFDVAKTQRFQQLNSQDNDQDQSNLQGVKDDIQILKDKYENQDIQVQQVNTGQINSQQLVSKSINIHSNKIDDNYIVLNAASTLELSDMLSQKYSVSDLEQGLNYLQVMMDKCGPNLQNCFNYQQPEFKQFRFKQNPQTQNTSNRGPINYQDISNEKNQDERIFRQMQEEIDESY